MSLYHDIWLEDIVYKLAVIGKYNTLISMQTYCTFVMPCVTLAWNKLNKSHQNHLLHICYQADYESCVEFDGLKIDRLSQATSARWSIRARSSTSMGSGFDLRSARSWPCLVVTSGARFTPAHQWRCSFRRRTSSERIWRKEEIVHCRISYWYVFHHILWWCLWKLSFQVCRVLPMRQKTKNLEQ